MSCPARLTEIRDHAAGAPLAPGLATHLVDCPACTEALGTERRVLDEIDATLDDLRLAEPPAALIARARALADAPVTRSWPAFVLRAAAAALVVVGTAATLVRQLSWEPSPSPAPSTLAAARPPAAEARVTGELAPSAPPAPQVPRRSAVARAIVPPGQEALVHRFAALVDSGIVDAPERIVRPEESGTPLGEPPELVVPPLNIQPIEADEAPSEE
jgi:hypothetical protein